MTQVREVPVVFGCGGQRLLGIVSQPAQNRSRVGVVIVVGGPQYRVGSHRQFVLMARALAGAGLPVLRFDYRGMGDSDGETRSFEHVSEDISAAIDEFMRVVPGMDGVVLWGLCDGASAASMYCAGDRRVQGLILANPWVRTMAGEARSYLRYYYLQRLLQRSFWSKVFSGRFNPARSIGELSVTVKQAQSATAAAAPSAFIDAMRAGLQKFTGRTLFLISERDLVAKQFVDLCQQQKPWNRIMASSKVATVVLPAADHTFSAREDLDKVSRHCIEWLQALAAARTAA